jgi:hypothetical protein
MAKAGWSVAIVGVLVLALWVVNTSWRSRKQIWQIQSALIRGSVGFVVGRLTSKNGLGPKPEPARLEIANQNARLATG